MVQTERDVAGKVVAVSVVVGGALLAALVAVIAMFAALPDDGESVATGAMTVPTSEAPSATTVRMPNVPATTRDISITDEPIVIDADGDIVDPAGGDGRDDPDGAAGSATGTATASEVDDNDDEPEGRNLFGGDDPEDKLMPDVVCMGLQDAQDEIQDHGVFGSKSKDASGKGRRQLWDRNWIVVRQEPAPGEPIGEFEAVLYVVKTNEDNDC